MKVEGVNDERELSDTHSPSTGWVLRSTERANDSGEQTEGHPALPTLQASQQFYDSVSRAEIRKTRTYAGNLMILNLFHLKLDPDFFSPKTLRRGTLKSGDNYNFMCSLATQERHPMVFSALIFLVFSFLFFFSWLMHWFGKPQCQLVFLSRKISQIVNGYQSIRNKSQLINIFLRRGLKQNLHFKTSCMK